MCCDIKYKNICGRTMEFCENLQTEIVFHMNGRKMEIYSYVGIKTAGISGIIDGINEKGLSCSLLTMEATVYFDLLTSFEPEFVNILDIPSNILSYCASVKEAKIYLENKSICGGIIPDLNKTIGLHFVIHDIKESIVCEILEGKLCIFENKLGVVTNGPCYMEQLFEWENFCFTDKSIPGDWSSKSRFIKCCEILKRIKNSQKELQNQNVDDIQTLLHIFNNVDIPKGVSFSIRENIGKVYETTQWVFIKDLETQKIYYRTRENMNIQCIDFGIMNKCVDYENIKIDIFSTMITEIVPKIKNI